MKICLVVDGLEVGGIERVAIDYSKMMIDLGHEVTIVNLAPKKTRMAEQVDQRCKLVNISFPRKLAPEQYAQLVKKNLWGKWLYPIMYTTMTISCAVYKAFCRLSKNVCRDQFDIAISFASHFNDLTFVYKKFIKAKHTLSWSHGAIYSYLLISDGYINLYNRVHNIVALVNDAQTEVLAYNQQLNLNIYNLYNPSYIRQKKVDSRIVKDLRDKYGNFAVMISRFSYPHKDQLTVVRAFEKLYKKYNESINLVLVGDGPDLGKVQDIVSKMDTSIQKKIFFVGARSDVENFYAAARLLVHASVAGEGLPTVMIEALAFNLPQVVTDSKTGPREILGDNEYGLLCKVEDADDMMEKIHKMITNKELYNLYRVKSKERFAAFEPDNIKLRLSNILDDIGD